MKHHLMSMKRGRITLVETYDTREEADNALKSFRAQMEHDEMFYIVDEVAM